MRVNILTARNSSAKPHQRPLSQTYSSFNQFTTRHNEDSRSINKQSLNDDILKVALINL